MQNRLILRTCAKNKVRNKKLRHCEQPILGGGGVRFRHGNLLIGIKLI